MIWPFMEDLRIYKEEQLQMINKGLRVKAFVIAKNKKYDGYQRGFASPVYTFFDEETAGSCVNNEIKQS